MNTFINPNHPCHEGDSWEFDFEDYHPSAIINSDGPVVPSNCPKYLVVHRYTDWEYAMEEALEDVCFYGPRQGSLSVYSPMPYEDATAFMNSCADSDWAGHDYDGFSGIRHDYFIVSNESQIFDYQKETSY